MRTIGKSPVRNLVPKLAKSADTKGRHPGVPLILEGAAPSAPVSRRDRPHPAATARRPAKKAPRSRSGFRYAFARALRRIAHNASCSCAERRVIGAGGVVRRSSMRARTVVPARVRTSSLTRRSWLAGRRVTKPRASKRSTMPVTFEASQARLSASRHIGRLVPGSIRRWTWHWAGVRPHAAATDGRWGRDAMSSSNISSHVSQASPDRCRCIAWTYS